MEQQPKKSRLNTRTLPWGAVVLVIAALLVFAGAALAQETTPQPPAISEEATKPAAGLVVIHVEADSPAAAAGVARGDIILAVDDDAVNTMAELRHVIASHDPGDVIVLSVTHGDEARSLSATLGDNDDTPLLGLLAVGDLASEKKMDAWGKQGYDKPGRGGRGQSQMPAMPFGRGQMPDMPFGRGDMPDMPFGRGGQGMMWIAADGALVMDVMEESAAAVAGLQAGDVITALNDVAVANSDELIAVLGDHKPGDVVTLTYNRDDATASAEATLGAHPDDETKAYLGVQLAPADPSHLRMQKGEGMMPFFSGSEMMSGVHLVAVTEDGPAAKAGLEAGDWISAVNGEEISDPQALVDAVKAAKPGDEMVLTVQGSDDEEAAEVTVTLGTNDEGSALLGVQIGGAMRVQRGPDGMNFDFHQFRGQDGEGRGQMPFFFGRPGQQQDGGRFEFRMPQFRFQMPGNDDAPATPDARYQQQPGYSTQGA